jgi:CRP/FNR family cyclic AMP-dependent transcriptional regulator
MSVGTVQVPGGEMAVPMTQAAIKGWLRAVPLFSELPSEDLDMLTSTSRSASAKKNTRIFEEGAPADCCLILTSGRARVVLSSWGDTEIVLGVLKPKSLAGEIALFNRSTRSASVIAAEDCHFIRIPLASFDKLRKNPQFEDKVVSHVISTLLRQASDQVRLRSAASSMTRVAASLGQLASREGARDGASVVIPRKTHQELADMIGCSRETVSRKLEALKRKKCISWDRETIRLDVEALQRFVRMELGVSGPG